jgi:hypothetical protein
MKNITLIIIPLSIILLQGFVTINTNLNLNKYKEDRQDSEWLKTFDGNEFQEILSMTKTSKGGFILSGWTNSEDLLHQNAWLIKTNIYGDPEWDISFGADRNAESYCVIEASDGGFVFTGVWEKNRINEIFLAKTDKFGAILWVQTYDSDEETWGNSLIEVNDGYVILGKNGRDIWLIKTDVNGNLIWDKTFGGNSGDKGNTIIETADSGFIFTGYTYSYGINGDIWVVKTDNYGIEQWNKSYGGNNYDRGSDIIETNDGNYMITGGITPNGKSWNDVCLLKIDKNGNEIWKKVYGGIDLDYGNDLIQVSDGCYFIAASTRSYGLSVAGGATAWLLKTDENGVELWNKTFGGRGEDGFTSIFQSNDGGIILGGSTENFGNEKSAWLIFCDDYFPPKIKITNPEINYLYIGDNKIFKIGSITIIIGKKTIDADTIDPNNRIKRVEFFIESSTETLYEYSLFSEPYSWQWDGAIAGYCYIGTAAYYSINSAYTSDSIFPWMFNV